MKHVNVITLAGLILFAAPAFAQTQVASTDTARADAGSASATKAEPKRAEAATVILRQIELQNYRPVDARGLNVFEPPKSDNVPFTGFKLNIGGAFTQQFQGLDHSNTAAPKLVAGVDQNKLVQIGHGPNNAVANLYVDAQLARGIRVSMTGYLSARHHNETWVKDGYLLVDASPIDLAPLNELMKYVTIRAGHFEVNYGDTHFRRTDNGNAMFNPLVGNYVLDAFTTEVGGEVYLRGRGALDGAFAMGGVFGGESRGMIQKPQQRSPAFLGKAGYDTKLGSDLRVRLTGSLFSHARSTNQTLYNGDRAGSRYYDVMEYNTDEKAAAWSGAINPGYGGVHAFVINPFLKVGGLELYGNIEQSRGRTAAETADRKWTQNVGEVVYRLFDDRLYAAARYNTAKGKLAGIANEVSVDRTQAGGGWFITPNIMAKLEYVTQKYNDFPTSDIRSGGKFQGYMLEGTVAF